MITYTNENGVATKTTTEVIDLEVMIAERDAIISNIATQQSQVDAMNELIDQFN